MKLIIAGGRDRTIDTHRLYLLLSALGLHPTEIVSGRARGIDACGEALAFESCLPVKPFPPDFHTHGIPAAYHIRNGEMAEYADALLLIWDGRSSGSSSMKSKMKAQGKPIYEVILP